MVDTVDERRKILEMVAEGKLSPSEAADLLGAVETGRPTVSVDTPARSIKVVGTFRALEVVGDPSVAGATAQGPHKLREEEGALIFEEVDDDDEGSYTLFGPGKRLRGSIKINDKRFSWGPGTPPVLKIHMNPDLPLAIEMTAGTAQIRNLHSTIKANLTAGNGRFEQVTGPLDIGLDAGTAHISGRFTEGESNIRCTAGKLRLELERGSDARVVAKSTLGKIQMPPEAAGGDWAGIGGGKRELVVGDGKASINIEATTGHVSIEVKD